MNSREFRGYYCSRCHTYTRLYRDSKHGGFGGKCPKCGVELFLDEASADEQLFFTGGEKYKPLNLWDSYYKSKIVGTVDAGTPARVLGTAVYNGVTWYRVKAGGVEGWISGSFIRHLR